VPRPPARPLYWLGAAPLFLAGLIDLLRLWKVGPMTGLGALSLGQAVLAGLVFLLCARYPLRVLKLIAPFALFLGWAVASVSWFPPGVQGAQNLVAYVLFGIAVATGATLAAFSSSRTTWVFDWAAHCASIAGLGLIAASALFRGWPPAIDTVPWLVHPRAAALMGLAPLAWHLTRWYYGRSRDLVFVALWVVAIFLTLSRMATLTAFLLVGGVLILHWRLPSHQRAISRLLPAAFGLAAILAAVLLVGPYRDRVFKTRPGSASVLPNLSKATFQETDRGAFWAEMIASGRESPLIGKGIGSSQIVMSQKWAWVAHPHNDYLRVWHDLGLIGIVLFLAALVIWVWTLVKEWALPVESAEQHSGMLRLAGLLALVALIIPMITDNAVIYAFVIGPVGLLVGAGLGAGVLDEARIEARASLISSARLSEYREKYQRAPRRRR
jgi:O-antigen ligase